MGIFDETANEIAKGTLKSASPAKEGKKPSLLKDLALAIPRGVEGFGQSIYNLADSVVGDALPDYNERFLGRSETMVGGLVEGATQFMTGFVPIMGGLGKLGKVASLNAKTKGAASLIAKGSSHLKPNQLKAVSSLKPKTQTVLKGLGASTATDFLAFDGQEERLSDLIQQFPALKNPVTEFLQADEKDTQVEGRLKNVLEGLFVEAGIGAIAVPFVKGIKLIKNRNKNMAKGMTKVEAQEKALKDSDLTEDEITTEYVPREQAAKERAEEDALMDEMGGDYGSPDMDVQRQGDFDESANIPADTPLDERGLARPPEERDLPEMPEDSARPLDPTDDPNPYVDPDADEPIGGRIGGKEVDEIPDTKPKETGEEKLETDLYNDVLTTVRKVLDKAGNFIEGGEQAIKSAYRGFRSQSERAMFTKALAEERLARAKKAGTLPSTTADELVGISRDRIDILNSGDVNGVEAAIKRLKNDPEKLTEFRIRQDALYEIQEYAAENVAEAAKNFKAVKEADLKTGSGGVEKARTELFIALEQLTDAQQLWAEVGREYSLGLLSRRFLYKKGHSKLAGTKALEDKRQGFDFDRPERATKEAMESYRDRMTGSINEDKMVNILIAATNAQDMQHMLKGMNKLNAKQRLHNSADMVKEYWLNSLLSAPSTQLVNIMGNFLTQGIRQAEVIVGAAMRGDTNLVRANMNLTYYFESFQEALTLARKTMTTNEAVTIPDRRAFLETNFDQRSITAKNVGLDDDSTMGKAFNWLGEWVGLPSRFLLTGDEFFKALNYRHYVRTELSVAGYEKGLRGEDLAKYVEDRFQASVTKTGAMYSEDALYREANIEADKARSTKYGTIGLKHGERRKFIDNYMDENRSKMDGFSETEQETILNGAKQATLINTHTQDAKYGSMKEITKIINDNPLLTYVVPFVRTPANILKFALGRTGLKAVDFKTYKRVGELRQSERKAMELQQKLNSGERREIAEIQGQLATAAGMTSLGFFYAMNNSEFITGFGPRDKEQREAWKNAGNQEYSIRVGDTWYSYQRLDPFATMIGIYADLIEGSRSGELDGDQASNVFALLALTFQNNITNKSYVQGIDNLFQVLRDPMKNGSRFVGNIAAGFMPNVMNHAMNYQEDRILRETRGTLDYMMKRTPYLNKRLMPKRDIFGDVMTMPTSGIRGVLDPIYRKEVSTDLVNHEFANLSHGFSMPSDKILGSVDMHKYENEGGQTAYDRMVEIAGTTKIDGMTQKEALRKLIQTPEYQAMNLEGDDALGIKSPRVKALQRVMSRYRRRAKSLTLNEFSELRNAYTTTLEQRRLNQ